MFIYCYSIHSWIQLFKNVAMGSQGTAWCIAVFGRCGCICNYYFLGKQIKCIEYKKYARQGNDTFLVAYNNINNNDNEWLLLSSYYLIAIIIWWLTMLTSLIPVSGTPKTTSNLTISLTMLHLHSLLYVAPKFDTSAI